MRTFAIFCHFQPKLQPQQLLSDSHMDHTTCLTYKAVFSPVNSQIQFEKIILVKYQILTFFNYRYNYFVVIAEKNNDDLSQRTPYRRLQ